MDDNARTGELRRKLEKDPGSRLFAQLAEELRKDGKHDEAISVARKGLEKNPNYPSARLTLARALLDSGRPVEARPELEAIVKASPDNIMASRLLGDALGELGETAKALQQYEKTLKISPGDRAVIERMTELKARMAAPSAPEPPPAVLAAAPPVGVADAPPAPPSALPSVFGEAPLPSVFPETPVQAPAAPAAAAVVPAPAPPAANVALDRDLASGTFSPGSLNAADLQKHFEETAAPSADLDATVGFGEMSRSVEAAGAETLAFDAPPAGESDPGAQTLPLTSLTLADLYLQQGLKAEASAVLSQVLKEEPENAQAKSKLAAVSSELSQAPPPPEVPEPPAVPAPSAASAAPAAPAPAPAARSRAEIRERTLISLKAFANAVEREAVLQKATERGAF